MGSLGVTEKAGRVRVVPTTHGSSTYVMGSNAYIGVTWDHSPKAGRVRVVCNDTCFLASSSSPSSFCQHTNISETLCPMILIVGHNNKSVNAHF